MDSKNVYKKRWYWDGTSLKMTFSYDAPKLLVLDFEQLKAIDPKELEPGTIAHIVGDYQEKASAELGPDKIWYYTNSDTGEMETIWYTPPVSPDGYTINMRCLTPEEYDTSYKSLFPPETTIGRSAFIRSIPSQMPYPYVEQYGLDGYMPQYNLLIYDESNDLYEQMKSGSIKASALSEMIDAGDDVKMIVAERLHMPYDVKSGFRLEATSMPPEMYSLDHDILFEFETQNTALHDGLLVYGIVTWLKYDGGSFPFVKDIPLIVTEPFEWHWTVAVDDSGTETR